MPSRGKCMSTPSTAGSQVGAGHAAAHAAEPPIASAAPGDTRRWCVLAIIGIAQLMLVLDSTIVNIALPSAQRALHFADGDRIWIVTAYALTFGSFLLLGGRLGDIFGRRWTFIGGLAGFALASAAGGAAPDFAALVSARAVQGLFAALLAPSTLTLLATTFTDAKERGRAFAVYGAVAGGGGSVGLLLGGALTSYASWRWCLYVNLIFAAVAAAGGLLLLSNPPRQSRSVLGGPVRARLRLLTGPDGLLGELRDPGLARCRRGPASGVRPGPAPSRTSAATSAGGPRPQPRGRLRSHRPDVHRRLRTVLLPHLLPPRRPRILPGQDRAGVPPAAPRASGLLRHFHRAAVSSPRAAASDRARTPCRGRRHGAAQPARDRFQLRRPRAPRPGHHRARLRRRRPARAQHRHSGRGVPRRRRRLGTRQHHAAGRRFDRHLPPDGHRPPGPRALPRVPPGAERHRGRAGHHARL